MNWGPIVQSSHIYILLSKPSKWQKCAQKMGNKMNYLLFIFSLNNYEPTIFKGFNFSLKGDGGKRSFQKTDMKADYQPWGHSGGEGSWLGHANYGAV